MDGTKTVSIWIPLDDVPRDTTLEFVSGSHKWDKFYRPQRFDGSALNKNDGLEAIPILTVTAMIMKYSAGRCGQ